jgi:hypothetical protein
VFTSVTNDIQPPKMTQYPLTVHCIRNFTLRARSPSNSRALCAPALRTVVTRCSVSSSVLERSRELKERKSTEETKTGNLEWDAAWLSLETTNTDYLITVSVGGSFCEPLEDARASDHRG